MSHPTFVSFKPWLVAMGNHLIRFRIKERVADRTKGDNLFYQNVNTEDDFLLLEDFNNYPSDAIPKYNDRPLENVTTLWSVGVADSGNVDAYKGVYYGDEGWFHDADATKVVRRILSFPTPSRLAGWSIIKLKSRYPTSNGALSQMKLYFGDGATVAMEFWFENDKVYVMNAGFSRKLQFVGAVDISPMGTHFWDFYFNNTTKKFRIFFDGVEVFAETAFTDYWDPLCVQLTGILFSTGTAAASSSTLDCYFDNIKLDWVTTTNYFYAWFVRKPEPRGREVVGVSPQYPAEFIVRVDANLYPIVRTFKESDEIRNMDSNRVYKIAEMSDISRQIELVRFTVNEVK
jgi:hypothetical protein